jgi:hypothetical protein
MSQKSYTEILKIEEFITGPKINSVKRTLNEFLSKLCYSKWLTQFLKIKSSDLSNSER